MKTVTKLMMGAVVMAASAGAAHAANTTLPSTDNSNLMFFVSDLSAKSTYTVVLSQQVNGTSGYFTTADALSSTTQGSLNTINGDTNFNYTFAAGSGLQTFITNAGSDQLAWGVIGGAYTGSTSSLRATQGNVLMVATSADATTPLTIGSSVITGAIPSNYNTDVKAINTKTLDASNGTASGVFGTSGSAGGVNLNLYGSGLNMSATTIGSSYTLYGLTSNGSNSNGDAIAYNLGTVSFNGSTLSFTGNTAVSAVPLPAAAWLFGSGVLGLFGIGRRRETSVVAA